MLAQARQFFMIRDVIEVETPLLSAYTVTEPNINSIQASTLSGLRYLQTSPEYAMKRLLAAGMGDVFQICKAFRAGEQGDFHNPEFTLVEWYRKAFDLQQIMQETVALIEALTADQRKFKQVNYVSYKDASHAVLACDLSQLNLEELQNMASDYGLLSNDLTKLQLYDFIFSQAVVTTFSSDELTVVFHYPASQASLAQLNSSDPSVAERFEVFCGQLELANGFVELTDRQEQEQRFQLDQQRRLEQNLEPVEMDMRLLESLSYGLPPCAGVAVGFDRVVMLAANAKNISDVLSFDWLSA